MQSYEIKPLLDQYNQEFRDRWEQTRFGAFIQACMAGAKLDSPKDLITFTWEKEQEKEKINKDMSPERVAAMKERMLETIGRFKSGKLKQVDPQQVKK